MNDLILGFYPEDGTMELNGGIIATLGNPKQMQIRLDEKNCRLMLRACDIHEEQAVVAESTEIGGHRLIKKIKTLAGWLDDEPRFCNGMYFPGYNVIVFDLREAQAVADREGATCTGSV